MKSNWKMSSLITSALIFCIGFSGCTAKLQLSGTQIENRYDGAVARNAVFHDAIDNWEKFGVDGPEELPVYVVGKLAECSEELPEEYDVPPDDYNEYFYVTFEETSNGGNDSYQWSTIPIKNPEDGVVDRLKKAEGKPAVILGVGVSLYTSGHFGIDTVQAIIWDDDYITFDWYDYFFDKDEAAAFGSLINSNVENYTFTDETKKENTEESSANAESDIPAFVGDELSDEYISNVKSAFGEGTELTCQATDTAVVITISNVNYSDATMFYTHCIAYGISPLFDGEGRSVIVGIGFGNNMLNFMRSSEQVTPPYMVTLTLDSNDSMYTELLSEYYSTPMLSMYGNVTTK